MVVAAPVAMEDASEGECVRGRREEWGKEMEKR